MTEDEFDKVLGERVGRAGSAVSALVAVRDPAAAAAIAMAAAFAPEVVASVTAGLRRRFGREREASVERRLESATSVFLSGRTDEDIRESAARLEEGEVEFTYDVIWRLVEDNEEKKAWAYGALLRAFDLGIPVDERPRLLRFVQDNFNDDLLVLLEAADTTFVLNELVRARGFDVAEADINGHVKGVLGHAFRPLSLAQGLIGALLQERAQRVSQRFHLNEKIKAYGWLAEYDQLSDHIVVKLREILRPGAAAAGVVLQTSESIKDVAVEQCRQWHKLHQRRVIDAVDDGA